MTDQTQKNNGPAFHAFTVKKIGSDKFWRRIGVAWYHENNTGLNIELDALPLDGRIVLRVPLPKDEEQMEE